MKKIFQKKGQVQKQVQEQVQEQVQVQTFMQPEEFHAIIEHLQREFDNKCDLILHQCDNMIEERLHHLQKASDKTKFINSFNATVDLVNGYEARLLQYKNAYVEYAETLMRQRTPSGDRAYFFIYKDAAYFSRMHPMNDKYLDRFVRESKVHIQQMLVRQSSPYENNDEAENKAQAEIKEIFEQIHYLPLRLKNDTRPCKTSRDEMEKRGRAYEAMITKLDTDDIISKCKDLGLVDTKFLPDPNPIPIPYLDENESILGGKGPKKQKKSQPTHVKTQRRVKKP